MSADEVFAQVAGFPGYFISNYGRVFSFRKRPARVRVPVIKSNGYPSIDFKVDGKITCRTIHSLVAEAFHGPRPTGLEVRHLDGDRMNPVATNLRYGTRSENGYDRVRHGTHPMAQKTHCPRGHALSGPDGRVSPEGRRYCLACQRARYAEKKARAPR